MSLLWPLLSIAGLGALHGLSPANGWMFAAACGVQAGDDTRARRALVPIAIGHAASIALVVFAVTQGVSMDRVLAQKVAGVLLVGVAAYRCLFGPTHRIASDWFAHAGQVGIALWSCLMATAHGAGLMLVPALIPLCMSDTPAREITASGSVMLALAAVAIHLAAMLATTGAIATGVCRGMALQPHWLSDAVLRDGWTVALLLVGAILLGFF
jgi:hypothetical protein